MDINVQINLNELIDSIYISHHHKEIENFICELDLRIADCGFTVNLIKRLLMSISDEVGSSTTQQKIVEMAENLESYFE